MRKILCCLFVSLFLFSCGKSSEKEIVLVDLGNDLIETSVFEGDLNKYTDENAKKLAKLTDFELDEIILYVDSGALSEKIILIKADKEVLQTISERLRKENKSLQESYSSYNPDEVVKLKNAVLEIITENTLIYCVSSDYQVIEECIQSYIKK